MNILFVCTGNTCRSPMAEGIFKSMLEERNIESMNISSAGISAFETESANQKAINTLIKDGINIKEHKARQISSEIIKDSDLILTMTSSHKNIILSSIPELSNKIYTLKEYAYLINNENVIGRNLDIADPFGGDYNIYERCALEIKTYLEKIINNIDKIN